MTVTLSFVRSTSLVSATFDVLAIVATYGVEWPDGSCLAAGASYGFPPTAVRQDGTTYEFPTREIVGAVVPSERHRTCASHPSISVGVRCTGGTDVIARCLIVFRCRFSRANPLAVGNGNSLSRGRDSGGPHRAGEQ